MATMVMANTAVRSDAFIGVSPLPRGLLSRVSAAHRCWPERSGHRVCSWQGRHWQMRYGGWS